MTVDEALAWAHANLSADPALVVSAMKSVGWVQVGYGAGHVRLAWPGDDRRSISVPFDPAAPEYPHLMAAVLAELVLAADAGRQAQQVLDALKATKGDSDEH